MAFVGSIIKTKIDNAINATVGRSAGASILYYDGNEKLKTTAIGVGVSDCGLIKKNDAGLPSGQINGLS